MQAAHKLAKKTQEKKKPSSDLLHGDIWNEKKTSLLHTSLCWVPSYTIVFEVIEI